ncbi:hypothetical protein F5X96DRAFT_636664 [Biscogniauxia mediterranea]|nr:hypothetical protein F5X96DRAFT_636664 [Biscogniauxia mediterranea]
MLICVIIIIVVVFAAAAVVAMAVCVLGFRYYIDDNYLNSECSAKSTWAGRRDPVYVNAAGERAGGQRRRLAAWGWDLARILAKGLTRVPVCAIDFYPSALAKLHMISHAADVRIEPRRRSLRQSSGQRMSKGFRVPLRWAMPRRA